MIDAGKVRFSAVAIVLHWLIAALILFNLYLGLKMAGLSPGGPGVVKVDFLHLGPVHLGWTEKGITGLLRFQTFQLHKSVGFTVLLFSLIRLGARLVRPPPALPAHMPGWEKFVAEATHWLLYGVMIGLPLTGWIVVSASPTNIPTLLFKTVPFPHIGFVHALAMETRKAVEAQFGSVHVFMAWSTMVLIVLHVGAALKHQFWDKDGLIYRMIPLGPLRPRA